MHSAARLTYDLDPSRGLSPIVAGGTAEVVAEQKGTVPFAARRFRAFAADVAIDDQTAGRGSALFRVYTDDGSGNWQLKYESPIVRGGAAPLPVSVDLAGASASACWSISPTTATNKPMPIGSTPGCCRSPES